MKLRRHRTGTPAKPDPQCTANTLSGSRCKLPSLPGTDRCALPAHQKQART